MNEKFEKCKYKGFPECPNLEKMNTLFHREKIPGEPISFISPQDLDNDAKLCENCKEFSE
jgi:hypothetical protein